MFVCNILTSEAEIKAIADEWRQLHARVHGKFSTDYDGFYTWWQAIGKHEPRMLHVVTLRDSGRLTAVLPLTVHRKNVIRILKSDSGILPLCDILCETDSAADDLWRTAWKSPHYDFARIEAVYPDSENYKALRSFAQQRAAYESFYLRFNWKSSKEWLASLDGQVRRNFGRRMRRLEERAPVRYEIFRNALPPRTAIDGMIRQKIAWCTAHEKSGIFNDPRIFDYFHLLIDMLLKQDSLFFSILKCEDEEIAYVMNIVRKDVFYGYVLAYDSAWAAYSPATLVVINAICWAIDHGLKGLDSMYSSDPSQKFFKSKFSNETQPCYQFTFSRSLYGWIFEKVSLARQAMQKILKQLATPKKAGQAAGG